MLNFNLVREFTLIWMIFGIVLFPVMLFVRQPYGRHMRKGWGPALNNKLSWVIMEIPALVVFVVVIFYNEFKNLNVLIAIILWLLHYVHRALIFPFRLKTKDKKMPVIIMVFGLFFNFINALLNGTYLNFESLTASSGISVLIPGFGLILFIAGMFINIYSDNLLIQLRNNSSGGYQIPKKFLFKWVSCPNFLGEIIEWAGFAVLAGNLAAFSFLVWTILNLVPRALNHHKWYQQNFENYSKNRKAIIPFIL